MTPESDDPRELIQRLRAGDAQAGATLDAAYRAPITRFAWGYLGDLDAAEDATQEVFVKVLASDTVPDDFRVWLYRIARNHCANLARSRGRRIDGARLATDARVSAALTGNLTRLVRAEDRARLLEALDELPASAREALRLRYTEGLSREEIARVLELTTSVVKSRLYEAMKRLRERAAELGD